MVLKLMMKNYEVLDFSVKGNNIKNIDKIISMERIPLILVNDITEENLEKWFRKRSIPDKRENFNFLYKGEFGKNYWDLLLKSHALIGFKPWMKTLNGRTSITSTICFHMTLGII